MQCVPRTLRAIASVTWMALSVALIPSSGSFAQSPQDKSAPQSKFADVNGVKLHYLVAGKGDPIVIDYRECAPLAATPTMFSRTESQFSCRSTAVIQSGHCHFWSLLSLRETVS